MISLEHLDLLFARILAMAKGSRTSLERLADESVLTVVSSGDAPPVTCGAVAVDGTRSRRPRAVTIGAGDAFAAS